MVLFFLLLMAVLSLVGVGLFAYGYDVRIGQLSKRDWRYMAAGILCVFGGIPAIGVYASYRAGQESDADPWECIHTHPEEQCHAPPMHGCWTTEVCDLKRLRDAGGKD